jgi:hydroxyethylthiazole kinase-like uncharacterized protein yjeF
MRPVYDVSEVRVAEDALMERLPRGALMERAATGLADACATLMRDGGRRLAGARVVLLIGSGNNGGDALYAGAHLAARGAGVSAVLLGDRCHGGGRAAFLASGGRITAAADVDEELRRADLVIDGILGIGGQGALRKDAAHCAALATSSGALVVAVDIPSGVHADSGAVADVAAVVRADATVTFGCLKPGLLLSPGRDYAGAVIEVDIGLGATLSPAHAHVLEADDLAQAVPEASSADYKYSRGVVGIAAGSPAYRGAAFMATGGARYGNVGMVHFLDRRDGIAQALVDEFWDVVVAADVPTAVARATAWVVGPGLGTDLGAKSVLRDVLAVDTPVVVDADALRILGGPLRRPRPTILTPHVGEFAALGFSAGSGAAENRLQAALTAARDLGCVVVLKGAGTVVASPSGTAYIDVWGTPDLGTAGSGDVLSGLLGALLAGAHARGDLGDDEAARVAASAVAIHGLAGSLAAEGGRTVTAPDIITKIPRAIALVRRGNGA